MIIEDAVRCKRCGCKPELIMMNDLWYARCTGFEHLKDGTKVKCQKWVPFEFLGITKKAAIDNWNYANTNKTGATYEELL